MISIDRRRFIVGTTATAITLSTVKAQAADTTGITSNEIRIGSIAFRPKKRASTKPIDRSNEPQSFGLNRQNLGRG